LQKAAKSAFLHLKGRLTNHLGLGNAINY